MCLIRLIRLFGSFLEQQANVDEVVVTLRQPTLHRAARQGHVEVVRLLLEHQANIDTMDCDRQTALLMASDLIGLDLSGFGGQIHSVR
ncbi:hypothetical protein V2W45_1401675 [Cenococcum geophilum]